MTTWREAFSAIMTLALLQDIVFLQIILHGPFACCLCILEVLAEAL